MFAKFGCPAKMFETVFARCYGMGSVSNRRRRRVFCIATAVTIALSLVIICLTSRVLGQDNLDDDRNNALFSRGAIAGGRARLARLRRLQLRPESTTTTGTPVRERSRVRVKAIKSRRQKVNNADRRGTATQIAHSITTTAQQSDTSSSSSGGNNNENEDAFRDAVNNGMFINLFVLELLLLSKR